MVRALRKTTTAVWLTLIIPDPPSTPWKLSTLKIRRKQKESHFLANTSSWEAWNDAMRYPAIYCPFPPHMKLWEVVAKRKKEGRKINLPVWLNIWQDKDNSSSTFCTFLPTVVFLQRLLLKTNKDFYTSRLSKQTQEVSSPVSYTCLSLLSCWFTLSSLGTSILDSTKPGVSQYI